MRVAIVIAVAMMLYGCVGTAVVLKKESEEMTRLIDRSVQATRAYYEKQGQQRLNFLIDYLAARPSCGIQSQLFMLTTENRCLTNTQIKHLPDCRRDSNAHTDCHDVLSARTINISPNLTQPRQSTITLLGIVASYQRNMSKLLVDKHYDTTAELKGLQSKLGKLQKQINGLSGDNSTTLKTSAELEKQTGTIGALFDLIRDDRHQDKSFTNLQALVIEKGPVIDKHLKDLLETYEKVDKFYSSLLARSVFERSRHEYNSMGTKKRQQLSIEKRKEMIRRYYEPKWLQLKLAANPDALTVGLRGLIQSHKKLQEGFKGNLTKAQRELIAKENQAQLKAAFKAMLDIVKLFS